jgi:hypothetical protein
MKDIYKDLCSYYSFCSQNSNWCFFLLYLYESYYYRLVINRPSNGNKEKLEISEFFEVHCENFMSLFDRAEQSLSSAQKGPSPSNFKPITLTLDQYFSTQFLFDLEQPPKSLQNFLLQVHHSQSKIKPKGWHHTLII